MTEDGSLDGDLCCFSHCQDEASIIVYLVKYTAYCLKCFEMAYRRFYRDTDVKWQIIDYNSKERKEIESLYASHFSDYISDTTGQSNGSNLVRPNVRSSTSSVRDAWQNNVPSNTKSWRKGGKAK